MFFISCKIYIFIFISYYIFRAKKTHEEVKKLNQIEEELKQLDSTLSNDVCILRNQIESASHDFMEAQ